MVFNLRLVKSAPEDSYFGTKFYNTPDIEAQLRQADLFDDNSVLLTSKPGFAIPIGSMVQTDTKEYGVVCCKLKSNTTLVRISLAVH